MEHDPHSLDKFEARNRVRFIEEIFLGHFAQAVVLPPVSFFFSAVPIEQIRNPPVRPVFPCAFRWFCRHLAEQSLPQDCDAPFAFAQAFARTSIACSRETDGNASKNSSMSCPCSR